MNLKESKRTRQDARNELEIPKVNGNKCCENFHRTAKLVNIFSRKSGSLAKIELFVLKLLPGTVQRVEYMQL